MLRNALKSHACVWLLHVCRLQCSAGCFECGITDQHVKGIASVAECLCSADVSAAKLPMKAMLAVAAYPALDVASAAYGFWSKLHQTLTSSTPAAMVGSAAILVYLRLPLRAIKPVEYFKRSAINLNAESSVSATTQLLL